MGPTTRRCRAWIPPTAVQSGRAAAAGDRVIATGERPGSIVYFDSGRGGRAPPSIPPGPATSPRRISSGPVPAVPEAIGSPIMSGLGIPPYDRGFTLLGRRDGQADLLPAAGRNDDDLGEPHCRRGRPSLLRQRRRSYVIHAGPDFRLLSVNDLADANHASAAVAGGRIFLEGMNDLYCVGFPN